MPLGLIINELVSNAVKYAFPDDAVGTISVAFYMENPSRIVLEVRDNGIGFAQEKHSGKNAGLGLSIVHLLADQLGGKISITSDNGTVCRIEFEKKLGDV